MADVSITGLKELQVLLDTLPAKVEANILRGALRAAAKPILEDAKANVPKDTGVLAKGLKISTSRKGSVVTASIKTGGKHGYLANWMEFGTRPHSIKKGAKLKSGKYQDGRPNPGISPRPFLRPALDSNVQTALKAAGNYIKQRLASRHGLDTSDITIGEDE